HSVFVPGPDGRPLPRPVRQLAVGDRIAICGRLDVRVRDRTAISVAEAWTAAGNDPWALDVRAAGFGTLAYDHRLALAAGFRSNGGTRAKDRGAATPFRKSAIFVHSRLLLVLLDHLGFGAGPKTIPGWVLALPLARLKWFLDGFREGNGASHLAAVSEALKDDLVVALGRFGVV